MLGAEPLASARATGGQNLATPHGLEAVAKSVAALAHQLAGLIGPLHESCLRFALKGGIAIKGRLIRTPGRGVKYETTLGWQGSRFASNISDMGPPQMATRFP